MYQWPPLRIMLSPGVQLDEGEVSGLIDMLGVAQLLGDFRGSFDP